VWGSGGIAPCTLTSALDGGERSASQHGGFTPSPVTIGYKAVWGPNVLVEWLAALRIREVRGSDLGPDTGYAD
jgi:hypothetical protein